MIEDIALMEYDDDQEAVVSPCHEQKQMKLPKTLVFAFVGEVVEEFAKNNGARIVEEFESITKIYPIYVIDYKGKEICMCQAPCGAPAATQILDFLIGYGVEKIIATGSCGVLRDISENSFLIPERALRDEGTSFHYLPPSRYVELDQDMRQVMEAYFKAHSIPYELCTTWTTDGFFRDTKKKVMERREEGCATVEMECSALAACANFRGAKFGQFLFTADSLHAVDDYDERNWGRDSLEPALKLAMDIAAEL